MEPPPPQSSPNSEKRKSAGSSSSRSKKGPIVKEEYRNIEEYLHVDNFDFKVGSSLEIN